MPDIDTLIATFPEQIQNNALRSAQTALENQNVQQNALKLQQQQAGQNALKSIYSDPANIDPTTGLPRPRVLGTLFQADSALGLDTAEALGRLQEYQSRAAVTNLRTNEYYTNLFDRYVADPVSRYAESLPTTLPQEQKDRMIAAKKTQLTETAINENGIPESIANRWNSTQYNPSWPLQSEQFQKRQTEVAKSWKPHEEIGEDGVTKTYYTNTMYPGLTVGPDMMTPYVPTGRGKPAEKPQGYFTDTYVDDKGQRQQTTFTRDMYGRAVDPNDLNKTYTIRGNVTPDTSRGAAGTLGSPIPVRVPQGDGSTKVELAFPPKIPGAPWLDHSGTPMPTAPTSRVLPGDMDAPGAPAMSQAAETYMAERERLGLHMTAAWATSKYLPGMAETDIRSSLGLPSDTPVTVRDAQAAALNDVATQHAMKSESSALTSIARMNANVGGFEGTALRNANLVEQLAPKGVAGGVLLWNRFQQASRREIQNDPDMTKLDNAITELKNEYVRIMSSPGGTGQMTSDAARSEGGRLFNINQPLDVLRGNIATARQGMQNRVDSIHAQYDATLQSIRNKGVFAAQPELSSSEGTMKTESKKSWPLSAFGDAAKNAKDGQTWQNGKYIKRNGKIWEQ